MRKIFIIAEAGVNHNGDASLARKMVDAAAKSGADAVKFQAFSPDALVTSKASKAAYQARNTGKKDSQLAMLKRLALSRDDFRRLAEHCRKKKITFMATPFDEGNADELVRMGMDILKVPSGEVTNPLLLKHIASKRRPVILSTGMSALGEVESAVQAIRDAWGDAAPAPFKGLAPLTLLHCTTAYPAQPQDVNLRAMVTLRNVFGLPVGYSDHTLGWEVPVAAAALGAVVVEKHFTLDKKMRGPDHKASLEPKELSLMVAALRNIERALGDGIKRPATAESDIRNDIRRSLISVRSLKPGERILAEDLAVKRPGNGIAPELLSTVVGFRVVRPVPADSPLRWEDLKPVRAREKKDA